MGKIVGMVFLIGGAAGLLYSWIGGLREKQRRLEEFILFLQKSIFAMETEKVRVIDYFAKYTSQNTQKESKQAEILERILQEIARRLGTNTYPNGQTVWEEVFKEEEQNLAFDQETFALVLQTGNGFFGRSRAENVGFLKKSLKELEKQQERIKEKDAQERKVWVPVGMLGAVMVTLLFL